MNQRFPKESPTGPFALVKATICVQIELGIRKPRLCSLARRHGTTLTVDRRPAAVSAGPVGLQPAAAGLAKGRKAAAIWRCLARRSRALGTVPEASGSRVKMSVRGPLRARFRT